MSFIGFVNSAMLTTPLRKRLWMSSQVGNRSGRAWKEGRKRGKVREGEGKNPRKRPEIGRPGAADTLGA